MKRYVVEFEFNVHAETPAKAIQLAAKCGDRVNTFADTLVTLVPNLGEDEPKLPTGAITGGEGWMCVITVKEHD